MVVHDDAMGIAQLPDESDRHYEHFTAWLQSPNRFDTIAFAEERGVTHQYVRKLRSANRWNERVREIDTSATMKAAESRAEKLANAVTRNETARLILEGRVLTRALAIMEDVSDLSDGDKIKLVSLALQHCARPVAAPAAGQAVRVSTDSESGTVDVQVAALAQLPLAQQTTEARRMGQEAMRQLGLIEQYYTDNETPGTDAAPGSDT